MDEDTLNFIKEELSECKKKLEEYKLEGIDKITETSFTHFPNENLETIKKKFDLIEKRNHMLKLEGIIKLLEDKINSK